MHHITKGKRWAGQIIHWGILLFLLFDALGKIFRSSVSVDFTVAFGYPDSFVVPLGILLLVLTILYIIPKTSLFGAIMLTGWLGGAVATHILSGVGTGWFPFTFGVVMWAGVWLRDYRLRALLFEQKTSVAEQRQKG